MRTVEEFEQAIQESLSGLLCQQGFAEAPATTCFNGKALCKEFVGGQITLRISYEFLEGEIELSLFPSGWTGSPLGLELFAALRSLGRSPKGYLPSRTAGATAILLGYARLLRAQAADVLTGQVSLQKA